MIDATTTGLAGANRDMLGHLAARLEALDPADREAQIAHLCAVLEQTAAHQDAAGRSGPEPAGPPLLICDWAADAGLGEAGQLLAVDIGPRHARVAKTRAATGRSLVSNGFLGADILHVPAGEGFAPHTHPGDHLLFVLAGRGTIAVGGAITPTRAGQVYLVEGAVPHAVGALTDHVILAVGAPHRPLDSPERQDLVAYAALLTRFGAITCHLCGVTARAGADLAALGCPHSPDRLAAS